MSGIHPAAGHDEAALRWPALKFLPSDTLATPETKISVEIVGPYAVLQHTQWVAPPPENDSLALLLPPRPHVGFHQAALSIGEFMAVVGWNEDAPLERLDNVTRATEAAWLFQAGLAQGFVFLGISDEEDRVELGVATTIYLPVRAEGMRRSVSIPIALGPVVESNAVYPELEAPKTTVDIEFKPEGRLASLDAGPLQVLKAPSGIRLTGEVSTALELSYELSAEMPEAKAFVSKDGDAALVLTGVGRPARSRSLTVVATGSTNLAREFALEIANRLDSDDTLTTVDIDWDARGLSTLRPGLREIETTGCTREGVELTAALGTTSRSEDRVIVIANSLADRNEQLRLIRGVLDRERRMPRVDVVWTSTTGDRVARRAARIGRGSVVFARDHQSVRQAVDALLDEPGALRVHDIEWGGPVVLAQTAEAFSVAPGQQVVLWGKMDGAPGRIVVRGQMDGAPLELEADVVQTSHTGLLQLGRATREDETWRVLSWWIRSREMFGESPLEGLRALRSGDTLGVVGGRIARASIPVLPSASLPKPRGLGLPHGRWRPDCQLRVVAETRHHERAFRLEESLLAPRRDWPVQRATKVAVDWTGGTAMLRESVREHLVTCYDQSEAWQDPLEAATFDVDLVLEDGNIVGRQIRARSLPWTTTRWCVEQALESIDGATRRTGPEHLTLSVWREDGPRDPRP